MRSTSRELARADWATWYKLVGFAGQFNAGLWSSPITGWAEDVSVYGGEGNNVRKRVSELLDRVSSADGQYLLVSHELDELRQAVPFHRSRFANDVAELRVVYELSDRLRQRYFAEERGIGIQEGESDRDLYIWSLRLRCTPSQGPVPMRRLLVAMREVSLDRRLRERSPIVHQAYLDAVSQLKDVLQESNDDDRAGQWPSAEICSAALSGRWENGQWVFTMPVQKP
jgi:hypothetical protein